MRFRLLALVPSLVLGGLVLPVVAQSTSSRQRISDLSGEIIAPGPVHVDRPWGGPPNPSPVRVTEKFVNRMRITELSAGPPMPGPGVMVPRGRKPAPYVPQAAPPIEFAPPALPGVPLPPGPPPVIVVPGAKPPGPVEVCLKCDKWRCGQSFCDEKCNLWVMVYGHKDFHNPPELSGWLMPHASNVPFFYTRDGRLFRLQARR